ncbi:hypothetical protein Cpir12675_004205 [Ceratocystis pirilliformis]|uniref:Uncharacterized protein n=1 Tax=Ceratocystis pirilliformis TaxID=259994 RepID=A0ABR3YZ82_9PEZI
MASAIAPATSQKAVSSISGLSTMPVSEFLETTSATTFESAFPSVSATISAILSETANTPDVSHNQSPAGIKVSIITGTFAGIALLVAGAWYILWYRGRDGSNWSPRDHNAGNGLAPLSSGISRPVTQTSGGVISTRLTSLPPKNQLTRRQPAVSSADLPKTSAPALCLLFPLPAGTISSPAPTVSPAGPLGARPADLPDSRRNNLSDLSSATPPFNIHQSTALPLHNPLPHHTLSSLKPKPPILNQRPGSPSNSQHEHQALKQEQTQSSNGISVQLERSYSNDPVKNLTAKEFAARILVRDVILNAGIRQLELGDCTLDEFKLFNSELNQADQLQESQRPDKKQQESQKHKSKKDDQQQGRQE